MGVRGASWRQSSNRVQGVWDRDLKGQDVLGFAHVPIRAHSAKRQFGLFLMVLLRFVSLQTVAIEAGAAQRKSVPSRHMRCKMTAILRARATRARLAPARLAIRRPHVFKADGDAKALNHAQQHSAVAGVLGDLLSARFPFLG